MNKILTSETKMEVQVDTVNKVFQADAQEEKRDFQDAVKTTHYSIITEAASDAIVKILQSLEENGLGGAAE